MCSAQVFNYLNLREILSTDCPFWLFLSLSDIVLCFFVHIEASYLPHAAVSAAQALSGILRFLFFSNLCLYPFNHSIGPIISHNSNC